MKKNLYSYFCTKTQYSVIPNCSGVGEETDEMGLSKWDPGNIFEIS